MASSNIGGITGVAVGQNEVPRSDLPSLKYDSSGALAVTLAALSAGKDSQSAKVLHDARIKVLEANFNAMQSKEKSASGDSALSIIGAIAISVLFPPAAIVAIPGGIIKGVIDGYNASCTGDKRYWLKVELDAEIAFAKQHPELLGDDKARKEFVYNFIYNSDPGYSIRQHPLSGMDQGWDANRHVFPEAQAKYDALARDKPLPVREYIDYD